MPLYFRQSTASQEVPLGYFVDSTDGNTEKTALTIANTDIKIWKTGATTLASKNSGGGTHISNGIYYAVLDATDTDTIGPMVLFVHVSGALAVRVECCVLDETVYDVMFGTTAPTTGGAITVTSGRVNADITHIAASAVSTSTAQLGVNVVNAGGTAWGSGAITAASIASNAITSAKVATDAIGAAQLATDAVTEITDATKTAFGLTTGTADSGTTTTMVDAALTQADNDYWKGSIIVFTSGTIAGQARLITAFTAATDTVTFAPATTQSVGTNTYIIIPNGRVDVELWDGSAVNSLTSGRVDVTVGAMQTDTLTAAALAADAVTEMQSGLSTLTAAGIRTAVGLASANLDTQLSGIDTKDSAIKAKTDSLTFTVAGQVDANIQSVNDTTVNGNGAGTPWGP